MAHAVPPDVKQHSTFNGSSRSNLRTGANAVGGKLHAML